MQDKSYANTGYKHITPSDAPSNASFLLDDCQTDNRATTSHANPFGSAHNQLAETLWSHDAGAVSIRNEHCRRLRFTKY